MCYFQNDSSVLPGLRTTGLDLSPISAGLSGAQVMPPCPSTNAHRPGQATRLKWPPGVLTRFRCSSRNLRSLCSRFWEVISSAAARDRSSSAFSTSTCSKKDRLVAVSRTSGTIQADSSPVPIGQAGPGPHCRPRPNSVCASLTRHPGISSTSCPSCPSKAAPRKPPRQKPLGRAGGTYLFS